MPESVVYPWDQDCSHLKDVPKEEWDSYLYYVSRWDMPGIKEHYHRLLNVEETEEKLKHEILDIATNHFVEWDLWFHDPQNGGEVTYLKTMEQFGEGTEGFLRVMGCLHMYIFVRAIYTLENASPRWQRVLYRVHHLMQRDILDVGSVCDPEKNWDICTKWENYYRKLHVTFMDEVTLKETMDTCGTLYFLHARPFPDVKTKMENPVEYRQFLCMLMNFVRSPKMLCRNVKYQAMILFQRHKAPKVSAEQRVRNLESLTQAKQYWMDVFGAKKGSGAQKVPKPKSYPWEQENNELKDVFSEHAEEYSYHVKKWDMPGSTEKTILTVEETEELLKQELLDVAAETGYKLYYHDHQNGGAKTYLKSIDQFGEGSEGFLRVTGCLHLWMGLRWDDIGSSEALKYSPEKWKSENIKIKAMMENDVMRPNAPCDPSRNGWVCTNWVRHFGRIFSTHCDEESAKKMMEKYGTFFVMDLNAFIDVASKEADPVKYRYFLLFYMMHLKIDHSLDIRLKEQFFQLIRHKQKPQLPTNTAMKDLVWPAKFEKAIARWIQAAKDRVAERERLEAEEAKKKQQGVVWGAGKTRTYAAYAAFSFSNTSYASHRFDFRQEISNSGGWHRLVGYSASASWTRTTGGGAVKVVGEFWRLGCKGCPRGAVTQSQRGGGGGGSGRRRTCKWVTIKRAVLVKRPVRRKR